MRSVPRGASRARARAAPTGRCRRRPRCWLKGRGSRWSSCSSPAWPSRCSAGSATRAPIGSGPGRVRVRARGGGVLRAVVGGSAPVRRLGREAEAPGWPVVRRSPPDSHSGRARFRASWRAAERVAFWLTAPFRTGPPHQWSSTRARVKRASESVVRGLHFAPQWSAAFRVTAARKPRLPRRACIARRLAGEPPAGADGYFQRPAPAPLRCS